MSLFLVATYRCKPGREEELASHLQAMLVPTRAEPGCETYRAVRSQDEPGTFVLFESYTDDDALEAHKESAHFDEHIRNGAWNLLDSREVVLGSELEG
jgi:quinol monooxygenase YgiN